MTCWKDRADYQKSRTYRWEERLGNGRDIAFVDIPAYVANVWASEGLKWPPLVETLHKLDKAGGKSLREKVFFPRAGACERIILHELAHSMTSTMDDHTDGHGPAYMGVYMRLLSRHLGVPMPLMLYTADRDKLDYDLFAKAWCGK